ncbi:MAG: transposase [Chloroflexota bacterium]|nr:transposase [Chloroflexota bacterium]
MRAAVFKPRSKILTAWIAKEELRRLLTCARTGGHRHEISARLHRFNTWCADSKLPELERLANTIEAWWPEILGFLQIGITNAGTEATCQRTRSGSSP